MTLPPPDTDLLFRLRQGEASAFNSIFARYATPLLRYAFSQTDKREEAEEMVQEVFVSLWARREKLEGVTALGPYLFAAVKYSVIHYIRHSRVQQKYAEHYRHFIVTSHSTEASDVDPEKLMAFVESGLAQLPKRCREVIQLRLEGNLSNTEIAQRMNITKDTVENYVVQAIRHFKALHKEMRIE